MRASAAFISAVTAVFLTMGSSGALRGDLIRWTDGGSDDSWFSRDNWDLGRIPAPGDDVEITEEGPVAFDQSKEATIQSIFCTQDFTLSDGILHLAVDSKISEFQKGLLTLSGGELHALGLLILSGKVVWQGTDLVADAAVIVTSSSEFTWETGELRGGEGIINSSDLFSIVGDVNHLVDFSMVRNLGTITHSGGGDLQLADSILSNSGTYKLEGSGTLRRGDTFSIVDNFGTISKSSGGTTRITPDFNNLGGTVEVSNGTLQIVGPGVSTGGRFLVSPGATLDLSTNAGKIKEFSGTYSGRDDEKDDGAIRFASGELDAADVEFDFNGDPAEGEGFVWTGGLITTSGTGLTNLGDAFTIGDPKKASEERLVGILSNEGTITHTNAVLDLNGAIHNSGTYELVGEAEVSGGTSGEIINGDNNSESLFRKGGSEDALVDVNFTNTGAGTLEIPSGRLKLNQGFTQDSDDARILLGPDDATLEASRDLDIDAGVVEGTGTIKAAQVRSSANFIVGNGAEIGRIHIEGVYVQTDAGTLSIDIRGNGEGQFDTLEADAALLDGKLVITLLNEYVPAANDTFQIIVANATNRTFATIEPDCWTAKERDGGVVLSVGAPVITVQPKDERVCRGGKAQFCVETSGGSMEYKWFKDGDPIGFDENCLTIDSVDPDDKGKYWVIVTNPCGLETKSREADLTVDVEPVIEEQPTDQEVKVGQNAQFDVTIDTDATLPLTYDWQKKNEQGEWETDEKHENLDAHTDSLKIDNARIDDGGDYRVVVSNHCGEVTSNEVMLRVVPICEPCDTNCDGSVDLTDIEPFIELLLGGPPCAECAGDTNEDGSVDLTDVEGFIGCLLE